MFNAQSIVLISMLFSSVIFLNANAQSSSVTGKYFLLNTNYAASPLELQSLDNNNHIVLDGNEIVLNKYQRHMVSDPASLIGKVISGTGPFVVGSNANATDQPVPLSFIGTKFAIPHQRGGHTYFLYSLNKVANVEITIGNTAPVTIVVRPGQVTEFSAGQLNSVVGRLRSDTPILVSHKSFLDRGVDADAYAVPPVNTELWGVTSIFNNFSAMYDDTTITVEDSTGNINTVVIKDAGRFIENNFGETNFQGSGMGLHITSDKPVSVTSTADQDGFETTAYLGRSHLSNRYGFPLDAEYVAIVCPQSNTSISLYTATKTITKNCASTGGLVSKAYFHMTQALIPGGSYLESTKPVYAVFEPLISNDEQNVTGSDRESYYLLSDSFNGSPLEVMSLENNNNIVIAGNEFVLNKYQYASITDTNTLQGEVISGSGAFTLASEANATDLPVPASFAGSRFAVAHQRGDHTYFLYSLHGVANVIINIGAAAPVNVVLQPGVVVSFPAGNVNNVVGRIQSDAPILVSHKTLFTDGAYADAYPVPPVSTELWGVTSIYTNFAAVEDNTTVTVETSNGISETFIISSAGSFIENNFSETIFQGRGMGLHVIADKAISVSSTADRDGFETTAYLGKEHLSNRFGVPVDAEYIAIVCPEPGTSVSLHVAGNNVINQDCIGAGNSVFKAYFDSSLLAITKGSFLESNKPIYVVLEPVASDDEQNLLGVRNVPSNNILVIVADDLGMDILQSFDIEGMSVADKASLDRVPTPNIDRLLISKGVKFTNVMANPVCSPTRASIQTGRYGIRTGVRWATFEGNGQELPLSETTIPELLDERSYSHAAIGKWHLSNSTNGGNDGPRAAGYSYHSGSFQNLIGFIDENNVWHPPGYFAWQKMVNGVPETVLNYAPTENVDDALSWLNNQDLNKPWFIWLAFNAPHSPFQVPPVSLNPGPHHAALSGSPGDGSGVDSEADIYRAMVEYLDEEIGRLINSIPPGELAETTIFFIGDNGTPGRVTTGVINPDHSKFTVYQQGIHVPMVVAGAGVSSHGRTSNQLLNSTDLFATILELSGIDLGVSGPSTVSDSISFLSILQNIPSKKIRKYAFSETSQSQANTRNATAIRDVRFKLIRFEFDGSEEFYDLQSDVLETSDLLPLDVNHVDYLLRKSKYDELVLEMNKIVL